MHTNTTRVEVDEHQHITVDWSIAGYRLSDMRWRLIGTARLWHTVALRSGINLATRAASFPLELEVLAPSIEAAAAQLMCDAYEQCMAASKGLHHERKQHDK